MIDEHGHCLNPAKMEDTQRSFRIYRAAFPKVIAKRIQSKISGKRSALSQILKQARISLDKFLEKGYKGCDQSS